MDKPAKNQYRNQITIFDNYFWVILVNLKPDLILKLFLYFRYKD